MKIGGVDVNVTMLWQEREIKKSAYRNRSSSRNADTLTDKK